MQMISIYMREERRIQSAQNLDLGAQKEKERE